jgi:hypothetical protein
MCRGCREAETRCYVLSARASARSSDGEDVVIGIGIGIGTPYVLCIYYKYPQLFC